MSGICDTCKRNEECRRPMNGMDSCRLYLSGKESNYKRLFGTPRQAAQTLASIHCAPLFDYCKGCSLEKPCGKYESDDGSKTLDEAMLEWLRGDAE